MKLRYVLPKTINKEAKSETGESVITKFPNPGIGIRHLQSLLLALCVFCGYLQRVNLSVTIVAMTKLRKGESNQQETSFPVYDWDNDVCSYLHSSFFIGYLVMNFPAACLGVHFNNKLLLSFSFIINGVLTCLTPFLITYDYTGSNSFIREMKDFAGTGNWRVLVALRAIQGLLQAFMLPTIHAISARWAPPNERGCLVGFILSGIPFGTMIILAGSGLLASNPSLGWPSIFYVGGMMGIMWALLWSWLGSNGPSSHPSISSEEQDYICHNLPPENITSKKNVPWKDILMSPHVWAIVVAHTAHNWGFWLLLSEMPTFLNAVSGFDIKSDGLLSSLPYLGMWCLQFPVMWIADRFNKKGITSITASRKIWTSIGLCGAACSLVALGYLDSNADAALILYIFAVSISCCCNVGFNVNHMDLTSNYAGIIMGLSNAIASTGGFGAPHIVGFLVHDITSVIEWRNAFYVGATIMFLGNLFYVIFGSGKTQSWNNKTSYIPSTA